MSFAWILGPVAEFATAFRGVFWHDTWAMVIPPLPHPLDLSYVPSKDFKTLIVGLTFGKVLVWDEAAGAWREPTPTEYAEKLTRVGIYHRCGDWMDWHWDPLIGSIGMDGRFVYPQLGFATIHKPYELRAVNPTDLTVFIDATFWVIRFPNEVECPVWAEAPGAKCDVEELFWRYMRSRVLNQVAVGKVFWEALRTPDDVEAFVRWFKEERMKRGGTFERGV